MGQDGSWFTYVSGASAGITRTAGFLEDFSFPLSLHVPFCLAHLGFHLAWKSHGDCIMCLISPEKTSQVFQVEAARFLVSWSGKSFLSHFTLKMSLRASLDLMGGKLVDLFIDNLSLDIYNSGVRI